MREVWEADGLARGPARPIPGLYRLSRLPELQNPRRRRGGVMHGRSDDMSEYTAVVEWDRGGAAFTDNRYNRGHRWRFDGGVDVPASASPHVVPPPLSDVAAVDPEEAF